MKQRGGKPVHATGNASMCNKCPFRGKEQPMVDGIRNPMDQPGTKAARKGINRIFALRELAAMASIISERKRLSDIARIFNTGCANMLRACESLEEGGLVSRHSEKHEGKKRAYWTSYEMTDKGWAVATMLKTDQTFMEFVNWVGGFPENH